MDKNTYEKYVKADCWRLRRDAFIHRFSLCELCGHNKSTQVHHLTYERLGHELDSDLVATCEGCHKAMHGLKGGTPIEWIQQYVEACMDHAKAFKTSYAEKYGVMLQAIKKLQKAAA